MGGRRDDSAHGVLPPVPLRTGAAVSPLRRSGPATEEPALSSRRGWLVAGLLPAAAATAAVLFAENLLYLRVALLAVCWAFVAAAFMAGNRRADRLAAAGREAELRHAYDLELDSEVAARHEYEVRLESRLRRETEDAMREELAGLRTELAGLTEMKDDLAALTRLRADLAGLGELRTELAALTELRGELAALSEIRAGLAGLGELRSDLGRMRSELTEQLTGELFVERMVMRAQSVRGPAQPASEPVDGRTPEGVASWDIDPWEGTRGVAAEPAEPAPRPIAGPPPVPPPATKSFARVDDEFAGRSRPPSPVEWLVEESVLEPWVEPRPKSPLEWLGDQSLLGVHGEPTGGLPVASEPEPAPRPHRRAAGPDDEPYTSTGGPSSYDSHGYDSSGYDSSGYDAMLFGTSTYPTSSSANSSGYASSGYGPTPHKAAPRTEPEPSGHARLEQILAESGVEAPSGRRSRRRRYRDEDGGSPGDDVLARVLGRN